MRNLLTWLGRRRFPYQPLISVEISRSRLLHNLAALARFAPGSAVAPVLKSNAYGHGLIEVASILEHEYRNNKKTGISFFAIDSYFEAVALRAKGIHTPLLVIGYVQPETIANSNLANTAFTITSMDTLYALSPDSPHCPEESNGRTDHPSLIPPFSRIRIHLKIDTGMRRQGILPSEVDRAIAIIKDNDHLVLEGICTHFADADNADESFTEGQIHVWNRIAAQFRTVFPHIRYFHAANTDGVRFASEIDGNVVRTGIGLYGLSDNPALAKLDLMPALQMKTILTGIKKLSPGDTVGYGATFAVQHEMTTATIPAGYYEGLPRRLSSAEDGSSMGFVEVGPEQTACPIIGRVSMNITVIDVSKISNPKIGMEAVVVSNQKNSPASLNSRATKIGLLVYELAVRIPGQLKRTVVE